MGTSEPGQPFAPKNGAFFNTLVMYEADKTKFIYDSEGNFTELTGASPREIKEIIEKAVDGLVTDEELDNAVDTLQGQINDLDRTVQALATDFSYKGSVEDYAHLPTNAATGDVYTTSDTGIIYVWDGNSWVALNEYPSVFAGTDGTTAGEEGLVPAPTAADAGKVLGADGTWVQGGPNVVQTTGASTTDVMSQNAATRLVYRDPSNLQSILIGDGASDTSGTNYSSITIGRNAASSSSTGGATTIGNSATASHDSVALGTAAKAGSTHSVALGYNSESSVFSVATGHSAKAKGAYGYSVAIGYNAQVDTQGTGVALGSNTYASGRNSIAIGGSTAGGAPVTQATGESSMAFLSGTASGDYSVSFGADVTQSGIVSIETTGTHGYNSSNYRLLTGLYDPQSAHDAATKGYVDSRTARTVKILTAEDYNYPADNPTSIAPWLLDYGWYTTEDNVRVSQSPLNGATVNYYFGRTFYIGRGSSGEGWSGKYMATLGDFAISTVSGISGNSRIMWFKDDLTEVKSSVNPSEQALQDMILCRPSTPTASTAGVIGQLYTDTSSTPIHTYQCTAIDTTDPNNPTYTWTQRW